MTLATPEGKEPHYQAMKYESPGGRAMWLRGKFREAVWKRDKHVTGRVFFLVGLFAVVAYATPLYADGGGSHKKKCDDGSTPLTSLNFHFSGDSYRPPENCPPAASCPDRLVMGGSGTIFGRFCVGQTVTAGQVIAQGSFAHYQLDPPNTPGNNIPLKFTGTWKATNFESFQFLGLLGTDSQGAYPLAAGVLVMDIVLVRPATPTIPLTRVPSLLTLASSLQTWPGVTIPSSVISSSQPDGVTLIAPNPGGFLFVPIPVESVPLPGGLGTMEAHTPVLFSTLNEFRNQPPPTSGAPHDDDDD